MIYQIRHRTPMEDINYAVNLYFDGLSLRRTSKTLSRFVIKSHTAIKDRIQKYQPQRLLSKRKKIAEFIVDKTLIKVCTDYIWLWVAIEPENRQILAVTISKERNMLIAEKFISEILKVCGKHQVSINGGSWYLQACQSLKIAHHIHSPLEKSLFEKTIQYIKDRTESFDD